MKEVTEINRDRLPGRLIEKQRAVKIGDALKGGWLSLGLADPRARSQVKASYGRSTGCRCQFNEFATR